MAEETISGEYHQWFDSFEEMEAFAASAVARVPGNKRALDFVTNGAGAFGPRWLGANSKEDVLKNIRQGWPQYAEEAFKRANEIEVELSMGAAEPMTIDVRRRKRRRDDYGDTLDMRRVWGGELDRAWERAEKTPRKSGSQRYATIYIDTCASSARLPSDGTWRAAVAVKVCDMLAVAGVQTEVWAGNSVRKGYPYNYTLDASWYAIKSKSYDEPLNIDRLAALSSVSALRVVGFTMMAAAPYAVSDSFGMAHNQGLPLLLRKRAEAGERIIRIGEAWSKEQASREVSAVAMSLAKSRGAA